jgi:lipoprotein-releasing system permease protein
MSSVLQFFLKKYMLSKKRELLRFDSLFMIIGIIVSVAVLTVSMAIFDGYTSALKKTILGVNSHIYIFKNGDNNLTGNDLTEIEQFLQDQDEVATFSPIIMSQAMISKANRIKGCLIRGIDWEKEELPTEFRDFVYEGDFKLQKRDSAVLGYRLAERLGLEIGDSFTIHSPMNSRVTPLGLKTDNKIFQLIGIYKSGMYEYDSKFLFCNLDAAAEFVGTEEYSMLEVKLKEDAIEKADYIAYKWEQELLTEDFLYQFNSWIDFNGNLFSLLHLQKWVLFIILSFLVLIASFNVISSVSTSIIEKRRDLGILKAYGASDSLLRKIFVNKALVTGFLAILTGLILGFIIALILAKQSLFLLKADVYFFDRIQVQFSWITTSAVFFVSMIIIYLASLVPMKRISRLDVTSILRKN